MLAAALCAIGGEQLTRPFVTSIPSMAVTFIMYVDNDIHSFLELDGSVRMLDILSDNFCSDRLNCERQNKIIIAIKIIHLKCISLFK
jgi:hypothetical protein